MAAIPASDPAALTQAPTAALPTAAPADAQPPTLRYGVGLEQAIEAVHATIELASRQGIAQARIALHPQELGDIRIHLTQTSDGLVARVMAATPAAAQALAGGHAELRQSLSSLGLSLLRLDIGSFDQPGAQGRDGRTPGQPPGSGNPNRPATAIEAEQDDQHPALGAVTSAAQASDSALVDIRV